MERDERAEEVRQDNLQQEDGGQSSSEEDCPEPQPRHPQQESGMRKLGQNKRVRGGAGPGVRGSPEGAQRGRRG